MSMQDPISDLLTRVRNALQIKRDHVRVPFSKIKTEILETLKREGFVRGYEVIEEGKKKDIMVFLKFAKNGMSVISKLQRISKPGCRIYSNLKEIKPILNGIGISVVTTPKGVLSDRECREQKVGGEILCEIW